MRMCAGPVRTGAVRRSGGAPTTSLSPPRTVGAPASGANVCLPGSHRGGAPTNTPATTPYRRSTRLGCECVPARFAPGGGAPTNTPASTSYRRSTRAGCECVLARFAPGAVLLQMNLPPPRVVGAPAPGANVCRTGSHRGGPAIRRCSYSNPASTSQRRNTRPGCE